MTGLVGDSSLQSIAVSGEVEANVKTKPILNLGDHSVDCAIASCGGTKTAARN
jgi:hypothetical protein